MRTKKQNHPFVSLSKKEDFPVERVRDMGARLEGILFDRKINENNRKILEYVELFLFFRKNIEKENHAQKIAKDLEEKKKKINLNEKDIHALTLWSRGSRKRENEILDEKELEHLYERVRNKLEEYSLYSNERKD